MRSASSNTTQRHLQLPREKRERNSEEKAATRKKVTKGLFFKKKKLRVREVLNNLGFKCLSVTQI